MEGKNREVELKFDIDPERVDALITHLSPGDESGARTLHSIYFDTLRVRKERRR